EIRKGTFRSDLFYRLNVIALHIPPLRERKEDIPLLADHFLDKLGEEREDGTKGLTDEAMEILVRYDWPGNVRELENALERAAVVTASETIKADALPERVRSAPTPQLVSANLPP
ncbi:MAG: two-component system response regulator, partial [Thermoplasmata archaeon]|nr:two-component system response regulator [Pseudomonadales bacterium]NIS10928.1 two-component system response regulator [Thermoplasmata archaeon]NIX06986.1 two-component system response regulator [Pseudomonadales bacterium]